MLVVICVFPAVQWMVATMSPAGRFRALHPRILQEFEATQRDLHNEKHNLATRTTPEKYTVRDPIRFNLEGLGITVPHPVHSDDIKWQAFLAHLVSYSQNGRLSEAKRLRERVPQIFEE